MKKIVALILAVMLLCACAPAQTAAPQTTEPETTVPETTVPETTEVVMDRELYVLMYHSVAPDGTDCNAWTITVSTFRQHMAYIRDRGYTVVAPSDLVS